MVGGKESHIRINGIFTCTVNEEGLLTILRGYWEPENAEVVPAKAQAWFRLSTT